MIIDCHGHYTTAPEELWAWRERQLEASSPGSVAPIEIGDDELRESLEGAQLALQRERGTDLTLFSPRASAMEFHRDSATSAQQWAEVANDVIAWICGLYPNRFVGVCQLPQAPGVKPQALIGELERCVEELGFVGCNLAPDVSGGYWSDPPITDASWYPFYEKLVELDVPAMIHVSKSCNPAVHVTGADYLNADTTVFMQLVMGDLFTRFPTLRIVIPHGGGAAPYHWGRFRGLAQDNGWPPLDVLLQNVYFDTCVYHQAGMECLCAVVPADNVLFASEMVGAVRGIDPETGAYYDDTKRYLDAIEWLGDEERTKIYETNARKVYPRLALLDV